jgi:hypothetical protein
LTSRERSRRFAIGVAGWVFGLAATVLLGGIWGRAVVVDTGELADTLSPLATSELVAGRISSWLQSELTAAGAAEADAATAASRVLTHPGVGRVIEDLVAESVEAAATGGPDGTAVDAAAILAPATGEITAGLNDAGVPVTQEQVDAALSRLGPITIREPADDPLIGAASPLATSLGTAAILGGVLMLMAGSAYVLMSPDRGQAVRSLVTRFALGALSFAVILRIGSWLVDPEGGRAPFRESVALLADSKWMVPLTIGLAAGGAALVMRMARRRVRPAATSR